ncbi:hypothetical protein ACF0H5_010132 [Mactra antiquata]
MMLSPYMQEPPPGYAAQPAGQPPIGYTQQPPVVGAGPQGYGQPPQTVIMTQPVTTTAIVSRPTNYFGLSLFSCLFCFWPTGLLALYYSSQTNNLTASGDLVGAEKASKTARTLSLVGIAIGCLGTLIIVILAATGNLVTRHYYY